MEVPVALASAVFLLHTCYFVYRARVRAPPATESCKESSAYLDLIGNTPLVRLHALSAATRCNVYAKVESLNPGIASYFTSLHFTLGWPT